MGLYGVVLKHRDDFTKLHVWMARYQDTQDSKQSSVELHP